MFPREKVNNVKYKPLAYIILYSKFSYGVFWMIFSYLYNLWSSEFSSHSSIFSPSNKMGWKGPTFSSSSFSFSISSIGLSSPFEHTLRIYTLWGITLMAYKKRIRVFSIGEKPHYSSSSIYSLWVISMMEYSSILLGWINAPKPHPTNVVRKIFRDFGVESLNVLSREYRQWSKTFHRGYSILGHRLCQ